jgi:hypothetical protein
VSGVARTGRGAAALGVGAALAVAAAWYARPGEAVPESAAAGTVAVRITRHDAAGVPGQPVSIRDRTRVRALVEALGVDAQPPVTCPPDYASADLGLVLSGRDVYARRTVYVWDLAGADAGTATSVLVVSPSGCRGGPPADAAALRREIAAAPP